MKKKTEKEEEEEKERAERAKKKEIEKGEEKNTEEKESGTVKTVSGTLIGLEDAAIAARDAALAAQAGVEAARALAEAARDAAAVAETGAETARDDAQTSALAAETARDTAASAAAVAGNAFTDIDQKVLNGQDQLQTAVDAALAEAQAIEVNTGTSAADAAASGQAALAGPLLKPFAATQKRRQRGAMIVRRPALQFTEGDGAKTQTFLAGRRGAGGRRPRRAAGQRDLLLRRRGCGSRQPPDGGARHGALPDHHLTPPPTPGGTPMPINPEAVGLEGEPLRRAWNSKDALLYAIGVGADTEELAFTTENTKHTPQRVLPTMAVVLGGGGVPFGKLGTFNAALMLHGAQRIDLFGEIRKPLIDRGVDRLALYTPLQVAVESHREFAIAHHPLAPPASFDCALTGAARVVEQ